MQDNSTSTCLYATVILPLAVPVSYTYSIPTYLLDQVKWGVRVEVPLRNKVYSGLIVDLQESVASTIRTKDIISVIDELPVITLHQYNMWLWIANYYCCTVGEVMNVALPSGLKLQSETKIIYNFKGDQLPIDLDDEAYIIAEALQLRNELTIEEIRLILGKKTIYPTILRLIDAQILYIKEELRTRFKPKMVSFVTLTEYYQQAENRLTEAMDLVARSQKQTQALLSYIKLSRNGFEQPASAIYELADINSSVLNAMVKKNIFELYKKEVSRISYEEEQLDGIPPLTSLQMIANEGIKESFDIHKPVLLHGVTGSGKTRLYIEWIQKALENDGQSLYLLPEIALTTHIVARLRSVFGDQIGVFHSKLSQNERVELWKACMLNQKKLIIGARSSIFLPFYDLKLIIVDEEHDPSYKQVNPSPRYNARDLAVYMAVKLKANIILGSATPSLESYHNAQKNKYKLVELLERYSTVALPKTSIVDLGLAIKKRQVVHHFSTETIAMIQGVLNQKNQVLIFQNRRGYTPIMTCQDCGWISECTHCDVSMTYHKFFHELRCHYCGSREKVPAHCPSCSGTNISPKGLGTEKIEENVKEIFPHANVSRLDFDTAKSKGAFESIMLDFENKNIDILIGTQMITKGLDFDSIALVVIVNADMILRYPDFRANERAFQLFTQVSGRAGRRDTQGAVAIQTYTPDHPIITETINHDFKGFYMREMTERNAFYYPPFTRLIYVTIKHKDARRVGEAAEHYAALIRKKIGTRVLGPAIPGISRIRNQYIQNIIVKLETDPKAIHYIKNVLITTKAHLRTLPGFKSVRVNIDVDPY